MSLLGIIFLIAFLLLTKAILETIWGTCLIAKGLLYHGIAAILSVIIFGIETCQRIIRFVTRPNKRSLTVGCDFFWWFSRGNFLPEIFPMTVGLKGF